MTETTRTTIGRTERKSTSPGAKNGKPEVKSGTITWKAPVKPGEYRLFIHAKGDALTDVTGNVTIYRKIDGN